MNGEIQLLEKPRQEATPAKVLFVCTANIQRSLTAEHLFRSLFSNVIFKSAGVSRRECARNNSQLCTIELLDWADQVFVFEQKHLDRIIQHTGEQFLSKISNLEIDDNYQYMQPELVEELKKKFYLCLPESSSIPAKVIPLS
ncbi:MAG: hypothetical protein V7784_03990 [Oceanospirillaceae bacterium]